MPLAAEVNEALDFLVTMIDVSEPGMRQIPQRSSVGPITDEACVVTISSRNAAPPNPDGPQVVFVGLTFVIRGVVGNGELSQAWAREISLDRLEAPPRSPADVPPRQRKGGQEYPVLTSAEQKLGQYLFPRSDRFLPLDHPHKRRLTSAVRRGGDCVTSPFIPRAPHADTLRPGGSVTGVLALVVALASRV